MGLAALATVRHRLSVAQLTTLTLKFGSTFSDDARRDHVSPTYSQLVVRRGYSKVRLNSTLMKIDFVGLRVGFRGLGVGFIATNHAGGSETGSTVKACYRRVQSGTPIPTPELHYSVYPSGYFPIQAEMQKRPYSGGAGGLDFLFPRRLPRSIVAPKPPSGPHYTIWTLQNFGRGYTITRGRPVTVTICENTESGRVLDTIRTTWSGADTLRDDGAIFRAHHTGALRAGNHIVIKPKNGILSNAYRHVQQGTIDVLDGKRSDNNNISAFHITIDDEAISPPIKYHIIYYDIQNYNN